MAIDSFVGSQYADANIFGIIVLGTTLVILPTKVAKAIHDQIPGSIYDPVQGWIIPDTPEVASLPGFQVVLGGVKFEVVMKDIMRERVYGKRGYVYSGIGSNDNIVSVFYLHARIFVEHKY